jgi:hypothetical protein
MSTEEDLLERLIDRIAEAVVRKIDERRKIDLIAEAVLARLEERGLVEGPEENPAEAIREEAKVGPSAKKATKPRGQKKGDKVTR